MLLIRQQFLWALLLLFMHALLALLALYFYHGILLFLLLPVLSLTLLYSYAKRPHDLLLQIQADGSCWLQKGDSMVAIRPLDGGIMASRLALLPYIVGAEKRHLMLLYAGFLPEDDWRLLRSCWRTTYAETR